MSLKGRIGQFFFFISLIVLVFFFATVQAQQPQYELFLAGLVGIVLGGVLTLRNRTSAPPVERFRTLRTARSKRAERKKKKKEKK
jgi:cadmium resistance protein CadD (predicted permease)